MAENVERIKEIEVFKISSHGNYMIFSEKTKIICKLPDILIQYVVDRERLVPYCCVINAVYVNLYCWKRFAERFSRITKLIVAGKKTIGECAGPAVDFKSIGA